VAAADFNGDTYPDLAVANAASDKVTVMTNAHDWAIVPPSLAISDMTVAEGNSGSQAVRFIVTLSAKATRVTDVNYSTANDTATAGSDYQTSSGILRIPAGQTTGTITVLVNGDRIGEPTKRTSST
jgi:hypothetical protein